MRVFFSSALAVLFIHGVELAHAADARAAPRGRFAIAERVTVRQTLRADAEVCLVHFHGNEVPARVVMFAHAKGACANTLWLEDARSGVPWGDDRIPVPSATNATGRCSVNPNRVLTPAAFEHRIEMDCDGDAAARAGLRRFLDEELLPALERCRGGDARLPVVAYHNNSRLTVKDMDARAAVSVPGHESDILFVTDPIDYERLRSLGRFSVALQSAPPADDGSLSVLLKSERYINVEAQIHSPRRGTNEAMSEWALRSIGGWRCGPGDWPAPPPPPPRAPAAAFEPP
jgi:hypothetical protein